MFNRVRFRALPALVIVLITAPAAARAQPAPAAPALRLPAVPLVAVDPYFSIWSPMCGLTGATATWSATLTGRRADFEALVHPVFTFLNTTPHRVPMTDSYWTHDATKVGFQARSVAGGVFLRLLYEPAV